MVGTGYTWVRANPSYSGKIIAALTINHTGTTTFATGSNPEYGAISSGGEIRVSGATTLTSGTIYLDTDHYTGSFVSSNTNTRSINFASAFKIVLTGSGTVLSMANATGFTRTNMPAVNPNNSNGVGHGGFWSDGSVARTYTFGTTGGTGANAPNLSIQQSSVTPAIQTFTTGSWFNYWSPSVLWSAVPVTS